MCLPSPFLYLCYFCVEKNFEYMGMQPKRFTISFPDGFLATLVALHVNPVCDRLGRSVNDIKAPVAEIVFHCFV